MSFEIFLGRLKVKVTLDKTVINYACPGHNVYINAWICLVRLKLKVTLQVQMMKWS